ncbi:Panacea domain-containing protein [Pedobacter metabolipauper]|uniref:Putative phage-associated protein n=1 Tax=Pedobacter metabolipauper TaxID=425513 RepID=A0A4R6T1D0_9SPHI|nr:type II toxin-antitoxin system antitoxin SocA domain-containing protein [Pedobacter metabolipauper]TDQ11290.1 putative phage-associated protein [Pedobacter metabolipauper]
MEIIQTLGTLDALTLADYILKNYGPMSHLKLQKLVFYCQAYHLGYFNSPLIEDDFQAWVHGPVCRRVFDDQQDVSLLHCDIRYSNYKNEDPDVVFSEALISSQKEFIKDILTDLAAWTGLELEACTHREKPWIIGRIGYGPADRCEVIISKESMREFYSKELVSWWPN